jgi:hypothetical protein
MKSWIMALAAVSVGACASPQEPTVTSGSKPGSQAESPLPGAAHPSADLAVELVRIPATAHGDGFALKVAPPTGDAIERWGLCLARVADCYVPGASAREREQCLRATDAPPSAGENVCPVACREAFERALPAASNVEAAVDASYKRGDCVAGFRAMSDDALRHLTLNGNALGGPVGGAR